MVRNPAKLSWQVRTITTDLAAPDPAALESAIARTDAVLSGLGPHSNSEAGIAAQGTPAIVAAMKVTGVRRIGAVSAAPVGTVPTPSNPGPSKHDPGDGFFMRHLGARLANATLGKVMIDLAQMEHILATSGLDWTVVRPPRLTSKPLTGTHRTRTGATSKAARPFPAPRSRALPGSVIDVSSRAAARPRRNPCPDSAAAAPKIPPVVPPSGDARRARCS